MLTGCDEHQRLPTKQKVLRVLRVQSDWLGGVYPRAEQNYENEPLHSRFIAVEYCGFGLVGRLQVYTETPDPKGIVGDGQSFKKANFERLRLCPASAGVGRRKDS